MQRAAAVVARACPLRVQTDRRARAPNAHRRPTRGVVANRAGADVASSSSSVTAEEEDRREPAAMPDAPPHQGYYHWPALHGDTLVFVCEDDLWRCDARGGVATRVTDAPGPVLRPLVSRDGTRVAFTVQQDACQEIYVVPTKGGPVTQVTHAGAERTRASCWSHDSTRLYFASSAGQSFTETDELWYVDVGSNTTGDELESVEPRRASLGPVHDVCVRPGGGGGGGLTSMQSTPSMPSTPLIVARNTEDTAAAHWKGYRGGCGGSLWLDPRGDGVCFVRLDVTLEGVASDQGVNVG